MGAPDPRAEPQAAANDNGAAPDPDADRPRRFDVHPDEVLQRSVARPWPWRDTSFFAPVLLAIGLNALLLYGMIGLAILLWLALR